jgi:cytoskeletal protein RodZ
MDGEELQTASERIEAFGRWLRQERELRDVSAAEIAASTRVGAAVIDALETGDEARMPPRAYLLGYLRAYAGAVGLDPDEVVLRWQEAAGPLPVEAGRPSPRRLAPVLVVAAVLGVVAAMLVGALLR